MNSLNVNQESEFILSVVFHALEEKLAEDLVGLKIDQISSLGEFLVLATGGNSRQIRVLGQNVRDWAKTHHLELLNPSMTEDDNWLVLDFGGVIVHILSASWRQKYRLEEMWQKALPVNQSEIKAAWPCASST